MVRQNLFGAFFCILVGISMVILWAMLLVSNQVAELIPSPFTTVTHITAETLTGIFLIIAGIGLLRGSSWANRFFLFASGFLVYAAVQATGYYIDHSSPFFVTLFIFMIIITAAFVYRQLRLKCKKIRIGIILLAIPLISGYSIKMARAGMIIIQNQKIALIERHRLSLHYFVFPGGQLEKGESLLQTAIREAEEELGLFVNIDRLIATIIYQNTPQYYYLVTDYSGQFGTGQGPEMIGAYPVEKGTYHPVWMPIQSLRKYDVRPALLIPIVEQGFLGNWPLQAITLKETS